MTYCKFDSLPAKPLFKWKTSVVHPFDWIASLGLKTNQFGTKPNLAAKILATKFGSFFCGLYNALKNMFNINLIMM